MDVHDPESMLRINKMVDNFRRLCCCEQCVDTTSYSTSPRPYTNFTVKQILQQDFGRSQYDSDGTYVSESSDVYSSCDECERSSSPDIQLSSSPEPLDLSIKYNRHLEDDSNIFHTLPKSTRVGFQADEDGYSSSDSEFAHAPLDLRVQRKKTPPKITSGIPAWVFCTRYSDRPSAGPRARRRRQGVRQPRTRTAFNDSQLEQLNIEFDNDQYLSESRRQRLANELNLNEANVKIWFQNKRAKLKKVGDPHPLARQLQSEGLHNHK